MTRSFPSGVTLAQYQSWLATEFGGSAPAVLEQYPDSDYASPFDAMAQVVTDGQFVCEGRRLARSLADRHTPVFFYSYEYVIDVLSPVKVIHGVESNILFGNAYAPNQFPTHALDASDLALHAQMAGYWSRFAATGNPNIDDDTVAHWQDFRRSARRRPRREPISHAGLRDSLEQTAARVRVRLLGAVFPEVNARPNAGGTITRCEIKRLRK